MYIFIVNLQFVIWSKNLIKVYKNQPFYYALFWYKLLLKIVSNLHKFV